MSDASSETINSPAETSLDAHDNDSASDIKADKEDAPINWWHEIRGLLLLLLAVLGIHSIIAKPFYIPSGSMIATMLVGDRLVVSKYPYGWSWVSASFHILPKFPGKLFGKTPEYGDIVIVAHKVSKEDYIKRVVGLPGDTIELRRGQIFLNGKPVPQEVQPDLEMPLESHLPCSNPQYSYLIKRSATGESICSMPILRETLPNGATYDIINADDNHPYDNRDPIKIPPNHVFLMGDNRDESADSRLPVEQLGLGGPVNLDDVGGRAEFIMYSLDETATYNPLTWYGALRGERAGNSLRPEIRKQAPEKE